MTYNWQQSDWKNFTYNKSDIEEYLYVFAEKIGANKAFKNVLPEEHNQNVLVDLLVLEAIKTSEIEGEYLSREDIMSSIKNNLGISNNDKPTKDLHAKGIAKMITEVRSNYKKPLTESIILDWHKIIFSKKQNLTIGKWRFHSEPMKIVSGSYGKETIHFETPPSARVPAEMKCFIEWFNQTAPGKEKEIKHPTIRCAIAHLYFESIHPLEDVNGRIGRSIAEKALLQTIGFPILISLSDSIEKERKQYYKALKIAQRSNDITDWIVYFTNIIIKALDNSEELINFTLQKTRLFDYYKDKLNLRQLKGINKILDNGLVIFEGGMTTKKYMRINKISNSTATRDLQKLNEMGIFKSTGQGRNVNYQIVFL